MKVLPLRLQPGADLRQALEAWMGEQQEQAGCLISAVGSLSLAQLRFAGAAEATAIHGELEIISLSGTLSPDGSHLHIAIADSRIRPRVMPSCESVLRLRTEGRQPPLHLQEDQPGRPGTDAAGPVVAQQLHHCHRAGADAQAAQKKAAQLL